jgi:hypothetical protein
MSLDRIIHDAAGSFGAIRPHSDLKIRDHNDVFFLPRGWKPGNLVYLFFNIDELWLDRRASEEKQDTIPTH